MFRTDNWIEEVIYDNGFWVLNKRVFTTEQVASIFNANAEDIWKYACQHTFVAGSGLLYYSVSEDILTDEYDPLPFSGTISTVEDHNGNRYCIMWSVSGMLLLGRLLDTYTSWDIFSTVFEVFEALINSKPRDPNIINEIGKAFDIYRTLINSQSGKPSLLAAIDKATTSRDL